MHYHSDVRYTEPSAALGNEKYLVQFQLPSAHQFRLSLKWQVDGRRPEALELKGIPTVNEVPMGEGQVEY